MIVQNYIESLRDKGDVGQRVQAVLARVLRRDRLASIRDGPSGALRICIKTSRLERHRSASPFELPDTLQTAGGRVSPNLANDQCDA